MSGILGAYPSCELKVDYLLHRGPDGSGVFQLPNISMGNTRLAILDLSSRALQPKWSFNGNVLLSYDGEIYNYRQIGSCQETSDTVALVEFLSREGVDFDLSVLDGMYAFGAYFVKEESLVLCRDPAGLKPLYIALSPKRRDIAFSSQIKGFFGVKWFKPRPNPDLAVQKEYLQYGQALARRVNLRFRGHQAALTLIPTLLDSVYQLCRGEKIILSLKRQPHFKFYIFLKKPQNFLSALRSSVKEQSFCDNEIGVQLSGGINSALSAYQYALRSRFVYGFYISTPQGGLSEDPWAKHAAEVLNKVCYFNFHRIEITREEARRVLPSVTWYMDEPIIRQPEAIALYLLFEYARRKTKVKVILTGAGARRRLYYDRLRNLALLLAAHERMGMANSIEPRMPYLSNHFLSLPEPDFPSEAVLREEAAKIYGQVFAERPKSFLTLPWQWLGSAEAPAGTLLWLKAKLRPKNDLQRWALAALGFWAEDYIYGGWKDKT